ncbi:GINS complex subunit [Malassezia brasiliensis]|uniref:GINS complex subunit n=1 Tax=Malassezia brasiliensis TaxID=1821822 RepID=A0AAF0IMV9_9BASI|nr:GINS complex subunit [Malassezia brasiliensis]
MSHARYALSDDEEEVPRPTQPSSSYASVKESIRSSPDAFPLGLSVKEEPIGETRSSIVRLAHAWLNERGAPEVQPWDASMVEEVMDQIAQQQSILDSLASDASTSEEEHFRLNLVQLDVERAKWLLRNYLRARLAKIETYAAYIMSHRDIELGYARRNAAGGMVTAPNLSAPVFVYCREDCGALPLPNDETAQLAKGTIHLLQYRDIRVFLQQQRVELL